VIARELAALHKDNVEFQRDLAGALARLQRLAMENGDMPRALQRADEAHKIVRHLADLDPGSVTGFQDVAGSAYMYGLVLNSAGETTKAIQRFYESAVLVKALAEAGKLSAGRPEPPSHQTNWQDR
jgi:hypothetical protein